MLSLAAAMDFAGHSLALSDAGDHFVDVTPWTFRWGTARSEHTEQHYRKAISGFFSPAPVGVFSTSTAFATARFGEDDSQYQLKVEWFNADVLRSLFASCAAALFQVQHNTAALLTAAAATAQQPTTVSVGACSLGDGPCPSWLNSSQRWTVQPLTRSYGCLLSECPPRNANSS
jgi:hypothetical protein